MVVMVAFRKLWHVPPVRVIFSFQKVSATLQLGDDGGGVLVGLGLAAQVAGQGLALGEGGEGGLLDAVGVVAEAHVTQHHHGGEQQGGGVGEALAGDVGGGAVDGLEDGALVADVARGGQAQAADEAGAHVGQDVAVEVGHDEDLVVVGDGVGGHLEAGVVEQLVVELDAGEVLGDVAGGGEEQAVGQFHDGGLVDDADLVAADLLGLLEGEAQDALRGLAGDELDALDDAVDDGVLDARVLALGVLADQDGVDVVVGGLVAGDGAAGPQVGEEVEGAAQGQVERDVALADGRGERALEGDLVALDALNRRVRDGRLAVLEDRRDVDGLPRDGRLGRGEDVLDGLRDLGADTVALDQTDREVAVLVLDAVVLGHPLARNPSPLALCLAEGDGGAGSSTGELAPRRGGHGADGQHFGRV